MSYFQSIDTKQKAYFLGFLAGDGYISPLPRNVVSFHLHRKDVALLEHLQKEAGVGKVAQKDDTCRYSMYGKEVVKDVAQYNLGPRKSLTMPKFIYTTPGFEAQTLLGLSDADGSFCLHRTRPQWMLRATEGVIDEVISLVELKSYYVRKDHPYVFGLYLYKKSEIEKLYHYMYSSPPEFFLQRKFQVPHTYFNSL